MSQITLKSASSAQATVLSNIFIDTYMPRANGEFVKVYIALLRAYQNADRAMDSEQMADALLCTEKDILRALRYWEKEGLLKLSFRNQQTLTAITFVDPSDAVQTTPRIATLSAPAALASSAPAAANTPSPETEISISPDRILELKGNEAIVMLLYSAEQYLGKTLTPSEMQTLLYFYDGLHMPPELIEYLIEYCVGRNHRSIHYIKKVAFAWNENGIKTIAEAKKNASLYRSEYYKILKALGITNRAPIEEEITFMDRWLNDFGFDLPIILEACSRTVLNTRQNSFPYTDKILTQWKKKRLYTLADIQAADNAYRLSQKNKTAAKESESASAASKPAANNRFHNFQQRSYDFSEVERRMQKPTTGDSV